MLVGSDFMPNKRKDNILKDYMGKNDIFADIVNFCLYDGKKVVNENDLKELDTTFVNENEDIFEKSRDLLKEVNIKSDNKNTYILFGIENQTNIDKEMVFRVLLYDALTYRKQFKNKSKYGKMKPVITIVIYYGTRKWKAPKSIHDVFKVDDNLSKFIPNYHINLIEPYHMSDNDIEKLNSDFKALCEYIKFSDKVDGIDILRKKKYNIVYRDTKSVINYLTGSKMTINEDEEMIDMCRAWDEFEKRSIEKGKIQGKAEGIAENRIENALNLYKNGASLELISKSLNMDIEELKNILIQNNVELRTA